MKKIIVSFVMIFASVELSHASLYWVTITNWDLYLDNGLAYIASNDFPGHCNNTRAQIPMSGNEYDRSLYAFALSAFKSGASSIGVVIDSTHSTCIVNGIEES